MDTMKREGSPYNEGAAGNLARTLTWKNAFWIVCAVPLAAFVNIGGVASISGQATWLVFTASVVIGFIQAVSYAELGGLFPEKAGGVSVIASIAWRRYGKVFGALPVWANLMAWMTCAPVCAGLSASYIAKLIPADSFFAQWGITLLDLSFIMPGLELRVDTTWIIAVILLLVAFFIQNKGAKTVAMVQQLLCGVSLIFVFLVALIPIMTGRVSFQSLLPVVPLTGQWDIRGVILLFAAFAVAGFITYAFETSVCYVSEFKDPKTDTKKAVISSAVLGVVTFFLLTFSFQSYLGLEGMTTPDIQSGTGVGPVMASMIGGGDAVYPIAYLFCIVMTFVTIMTPLGGSSRTLYQAAEDGYLPKALTATNKNSAPTAAMVAILAYSLFVMLLSDYFFLLTAVVICYMIFHFFALNSVWIHRFDTANRERPLKAPRLVVVLCAIISLLNIAFLAGIPFAFGWGVFVLGLICCAIIIPLFFYRHYVQDKGHYPAHVYRDIGQQPDTAIIRGKAGTRPYWMSVAALLVLGILLLLFNFWF